MFNCYNENTHNCDGRCQGASDCPMAQDVNISKRVIKLYIKKQLKEKKNGINLLMNCIKMKNI